MLSSRIVAVDLSSISWKLISRPLMNLFQDRSIHPPATRSGQQTCHALLCHWRNCYCKQVRVSASRRGNGTLHADLFTRTFHKSVRDVLIRKRSHQPQTRSIHSRRCGMVLLRIERIGDNRSLWSVWQGNCAYFVWQNMISSLDHILIAYDLSSKEQSSFQSHYYLPFRPFFPISFARSKQIIRLSYGTCSCCSR